MDVVVLARTEERRYRVEGPVNVEYVARVRVNPETGEATSLDSSVYLATHYPHPTSPGQLAAECDWCLEGSCYRDAAAGSALRAGWEALRDKGDAGLEGWLEGFADQVAAPLVEAAALVRSGEWDPEEPPAWGAERVMKVAQ